MKGDLMRSIIIVAIGSLIKPANSAYGYHLKASVFSYQALANYDGDTLPVFQLISGKQDTNTG